MSNKKNYIHDDRSLCNGCNSYKFGEHQKFCVFNKQDTNEQLLDDLIHAASQNNEFDNRRELEYYRALVLKRMKK